MSIPTRWAEAIAFAQALIGELLLRDGAGIVPAEWVRFMFEPCAIAPFYGALLWLNRDGRSFPGASQGSAFMVGAGGHLVWIEPAREAVVVARWLDPVHTNGFIERAARAMQSA